MKLQLDNAENTSHITGATNGANLEGLSCYHFNSLDFSMGDISPSWYIFSYIVNGLSVMATIIINLLVLVTIRRTTSLHSPSHALLFGLALSDLGVGVIVQPLYFLHLLGKQIQNKAYFCEAGIAVEVSANALCIISLLTVTAVSLDRYLALKLHLRYKELVTVPRIIFVLGFVWLIGAFTGSLWLYRPDLVKYSAMTTITVCLTAATFSYIQIYRVFSRHYICDMTIKCAVKGRHGEQAVNMAKLKSHALSTFWVYCLIILCYLPYFCVVIVITLTGNSTIRRFFYEMTALLVFVNSSLNPIVYCWRLQEVRNAVQRNAKLLLKLPWKTEPSTLER